MSSRFPSFFFSAVAFMSLTVATGACAVEPAADEPAESSSEELRFCRSGAPALPDRTSGKAPVLSDGDVSIFATLPYPPGNVAASSDDRVFVSMFPDTNYGDVKVGRIEADGSLVAFPNQKAQSKFESVLGIRVDGQDRLWVLDHGKMGIHRPKIWAFDAKTGAELVAFTFPRNVAPLGSMLNDVTISPDGETLYISDASLVANRPAIVVVDLSGTAPKAHRALERHASVKAGKYDVVVEGKKARVGSILCAEGGVDGIALDATGETLYYAPLNSGTVHRIATATLRDPHGNHAAGVKKVADATMTDGMTTDAAGNVYLTDMEHSQVVRILPDGTLEVVARDARFQWPDGFAWAPNGDLYLTASAIHRTLAKLIRTEGSVRRGGPYHVFRLHLP
jgi:sugar lactone lactonase YvrE